MMLDVLSKLSKPEIIQFKKGNIEIVQKSDDFKNKHSVDKVTQFSKILRQADLELKVTNLSDKDLIGVYENTAKRYIHLKTKLEQCNIILRIATKVIEFFSNNDIDKEFKKFEHDLSTKVKLDNYFQEHLRENFGHDFQYETFLITHLGPKNLKPIKAENNFFKADSLIRILGHQIKNDWESLKKLSEEGKTFEDKEFVDLFDQMMIKSYYSDLVVLKVNGVYKENRTQ